MGVLQHYGRPSIVVLIIGVVVALSTLLMVWEGIYMIVEEGNTGARSV